MLFALADGVPGEIERLCRFDVFEFFAFLKNHEERVKRYNEAVKKSKRR